MLWMCMHGKVGLQVADLKPHLAMHIYAKLDFGLSAEYGGWRLQDLARL